MAAHYRRGVAPHTHQRPRHPVVNLLPFACFKSEFLASFQKRPDLLQAQPFSVLHADDQSPACGLPSPSGSFCVRNTPLLQAHPALYKTLVDTGKLKPVLSEVLPLARAREAFEHGAAGRAPGKIVLQMAA